MFFCFLRFCSLLLYACSCVFFSNLLGMPLSSVSYVSRRRSWCYIGNRYGCRDLREPTARRPSRRPRKYLHVAIKLAMLSRLGCVGGLLDSQFQTNGEAVRQAWLAVQLGATLEPAAFRNKISLSFSFSLSISLSLRRLKSRGWFHNVCLRTTAGCIGKDTTAGCTGKKSTPHPISTKRLVRGRWSRSPSTQTVCS